MSTKKSAVILGLLVTPKSDYGEFFHITAVPVTVGPTVSDLEAIDRGELRQVPSDRIRNTGTSAYDRVRGLYLGGLQVYSQGNDGDSPRRLYALEVRFKDVTLDADNVGAYAKTLTTIRARMTKIETTHGNSVGIAQFLGRVALAIGATRFVFASAPTGRSSSYDDNDYRITNIQDGLYTIGELNRKWIEAGQPAIRTEA